MITIVTVWLCLITHVACDVVITVNNNGDNSTKCCKKGKCPCTSLSSALHDVSDNTVINITSESITLHDIVRMGSGNLNNITITGNGATIMCNNTGGVYCESCSDITIKGITWYQCGRNDPFRALGFFSLSVQILVQDCTFQNCPVYIQRARGDIVIKESNFITDTFRFSCNYSTGLYISYDGGINVAINNSKFDGNGCIISALGCDCIGVRFELIDDTEIDGILLENTNFSNYDHGLTLNTSGEEVQLKLFNVNVCNNRYGISIQMSGSTNETPVTVDISYATFINNHNALTIIGARTVHILSTTFLNNTEASTVINGNVVVISCTTFIPSFSFSTLMLYAHTINISSVTFIRNGLIIDTESHGLSVHIVISNSYFYNNSDKAILIAISNVTECAGASITFTNVLFYNTFKSTDSTGTGVLHIDTENAILSAMFKNVIFMSNYLKYTLFINNKQIVDCSQNISIQLTNCTFDDNFALDHVVALNVIGDDNIYYNNVTIELSNCNIDYNSGGKSIIYVDIPSFTGSVTLDNSTFSNNKGTALHLITSKYLFK